MHNNKLKGILTGKKSSKIQSRKSISFDYRDLYLNKALLSEFIELLGGQKGQSRQNQQNLATKDLALEQQIIKGSKYINKQSKRFNILNLL